MTVRIGIPPGPQLLLSASQFEPGNLAHSFRAELVANHFNVTSNVHEPTGSELPSFFSSLASAASPWPEERTYHSWERDFVIRARCDHSGHVTFRVTLRQGMHDDGSEATLSVAAEFGQLTEIARNIHTAWHRVV